MSRYTEIKLDGLIYVKHGYPFKSEFFRDTGSQVILTPGNFYEAGGFKRNPKNDKYYSASYPAEYLLKRGDIVVAMTEQSEGLLGSMAKIPVDNKFLHNQRLGLVTSLDSNVNIDFIYHLFKAKYIRRQIALTSTGSKVKHTSPERLYDLIAYLPNLDEQRKISHLLTTIDDKLELNREMIGELERVAHYIYNYWFVQHNFPISRKQAKSLGNLELEGKPYKFIGGKMEFNSRLKREIPRGWSDESLYKVAEFFNGLPMQKYRPEGDEFLPVIKIKEMSDGISQKSEKASPNIRADAIVNDGDVLFSWSATLDVQIWSQGKGALNQHIFKVTSDMYPKAFYYYELINYLQHFKMMAEKRKTTMGHITLDHLKQARICLPPFDIIEKLSKILEPLMEKTLILSKESQSLVNIRNRLLPMLMSGQVKVS